jgi:hypothetical protein
MKKSNWIRFQYALRTRKDMAVTSDSYRKLQLMAEKCEPICQCFDPLR